MKGVKLQTAFAKRREAEQLKIEQTTAVDKYFDKWGRITSRHEQWSTPEYYKQADETYRRQQEVKQKTESLETRRNSLRNLLQIENEAYQQELKDLNKPKIKKMPTDLLHNIHDTIKRTEDEKKRLELESRLYKKWRNGFAEESILLDSKSDHEAMAKMNWLDKQLEMQLQRDREKRDSEERLLRLQAESRRQEEAFDKRYRYRDTEVKELQSNQSEHINELKRYENVSEQLKINEQKLLQQKQDLSAELQLIDSISTRRDSEITISSAFNIRRIKMLLRQRSNTIRQNLRDDIDMLGRIGVQQINVDHVDRIKEMFEMQYDLEIQKQSQIEGMYESEAKQLLSKEEQQWKLDGEMREIVLRQLLSKQLEHIEQELDLNLNKQRELINVKEQHLTTLENLNEQFKLIMTEQQQDDKQKHVRSFDNLTAAVADKPVKTVQMLKGTDDGVLVAPHKFGKKKIAWN